MADIILFGNGQISEVMHFYLQHDTGHRVVAFTMDGEFVKDDHFRGCPLIAMEEIAAAFPPENNQCLFPISYRNRNGLRIEKYRQAKAMGYEFISYISPKAAYYDTPVGENTIIFEHNVVQPFTQIGDNVILWSGNHIGHHSKILNGCFIASQVVISGAVTIGKRSFIGVNATIHDNVEIGRECIIGAGAIVASSLEDHAILRPARSSLHDKKSFEIAF